jgi:hypothetical protein
MRFRLLTLLPNLFRHSRRPAAPTRPILEQLEDRCMPSANMMQPMGMNVMNMPPANMGMMNTPPASTSTMNMPPTSMNMITFQQEMNAVAALDKVFMNFEHAVQQFIAQEVSLIQTFIADFSHMTIPGSPMGGMK